MQTADIVTDNFPEAGVRSELEQQYLTYSIIEPCGHLVHIAESCYMFTVTTRLFYFKDN